MKIKAVLFDMDGVLIEAKDWHYEALNRALNLFGYEINRFEHLTSYDGLPTSMKLKKLTLEKGLPAQLHNFINEMKQQYTVSMIQNLCRPRFNHEYALSKLKSEGYRLAVGSNSIRMTIEMMMNYAKLTDYFDFMLSNQDVKNAKPDPEIYLTAISRMELCPQDCLIVEDNANGIKAAIASGAHVLVVKTVDDVNYKNIKKRILEIEKGDIKCK
ncbi:HAD family hydrolase [Gilliamella sp. Nev6-6]|uniref:HAD family hydrolase n=1 Tax=unclassified Gilliamella TaxID=2685620 RepID=UPI00080ED144|nr:HAD family phosphatase [Gilliamella apicola]OCG61278.1 HAD family hydrolase [Gilliamella apicola]OCG67248.1 HAD family hydrolase [Gilliamella apicola]OCG78322.1 HAD family hydrolase [Gilliamella apicola]